MKGPLRRKGCTAALYLYSLLFYPLHCSDESPIHSATDEVNDENLKGGRAGMSPGTDWWLDVMKTERRDWLRRKGRLELKRVRAQDSHTHHWYDIAQTTDRCSSSDCKSMVQSESARFSLKGETNSELHAKPRFMYLLNFLLKNVKQGFTESWVSFYSVGKLNIPLLYKIV